jgi:hypothetical protein
MLQGKELKAVQDIILKNGALNTQLPLQPALNGSLRTSAPA